MTKQSTNMVLMKYFGKKPGQTLQQFKEEINELSEPSKLELATLAAKALGLSEDDCNFGSPLAAA